MAPVPLNQESSSPGLVLVLHGLGMCPKAFEGAIKECLGSSVPWIKLSVPEAPTKPVTYAGGQQMRCWFDITRTPVVVSDVHEGLWESVDKVHEMIKEAERAGIPPSRVVLSGFSQGAVTALAAGLTYEHPLAGICAFSGWLPAGLLPKLRNKQTPIFMNHGEQDTLIPLDTGLKSAWALRDAGCGHLQFQRQQQLNHQFGTSQQLNEFKSFLLKHLSPHQSAQVVKAHAQNLDTQSTNAGSDSSDNECSSSEEETREVSKVPLARPQRPGRPPLPAPSRSATLKPHGPSVVAPAACERPAVQPSQARGQSITAPSALPRPRRFSTGDLALQRGNSPSPRQGSGSFTPSMGVCRQPSMSFVPPTPPSITRPLQPGVAGSQTPLPRPSPSPRCSPRMLPTQQGPTSSPALAKGMLCPGHQMVQNLPRPRRTSM